MELTLNDWGTIAAILSGFATVAALGFIAYQSWQTRKQLEITQTELSMTKKQMDSTLRPWLSATNIQFADENSLAITIHNNGSIPTSSGVVRVLVASGEITPEQIRESPYVLNGVTGVIFPGNERTIRPVVAKEKVVLAVQGKISAQLGFLMEYRYGENGIGEYGFTATYRHEKEHFSLDSEWTK